MIVEGGNVDADTLGDVARTQALYALFDDERPGGLGDGRAAVVSGRAAALDGRNLVHGARCIYPPGGSINHLIETPSEIEDEQKQGVVWTQTYTGAPAGKENAARAVKNPIVASGAGR
jgi:hypothetical protein